MILSDIRTSRDPFHGAQHTQGLGCQTLREWQQAFLGGKVWHDLEASCCPVKRLQADSPTTVQSNVKRTVVSAPFPESKDTSKHGQASLRIDLCLVMPRVAAESVGFAFGSMPDASCQRPALLVISSTGKRK
jgi:hypothetical protein